MPQDITSFVRRWQQSQRTERAGYQEHFRDLCESLGVPPPSQVDEIGNNYTFERRVTKAGGGQGFADVWRRGWFAWEYKSKGGDLNAAYRQLNEYHEALDNPLLLIVCDFERFEVHTKFENVPSRVFRFTLTDLLYNRDTAESALPPLDVLHAVFGDFNQLRPGNTAPRVTRAAAGDFLKLAQRLELERAAATEHPSKEDIAHFLMRLVFCLFADSVELLPNHTFRTLVTNHRFSPRNFNRALPQLFRAMSEPDSLFGTETIPFFNGGLFRPDDPSIELDQRDLGILYDATQHDWSHIEPAIFGTLFERSLDAAKRSMIGAHYTSPDDILLLIEPVIIDHLRRRWETVEAQVCAALAEETRALSAIATRPYQPGAKPQETAPLSDKRLKARPKESARLPQPNLPLHRPALDLLQSWAAELSRVRILDPACGSGNFLYLALTRLLDLWHEARTFGIANGLSLSLDPIPNPTQLFGIERDFYAHEIASVVVWIGFLQWQRDHGIRDQKQPILRKLSNIQHNDAILRYNEEGQPYEPEWPEAEYIVGNPPFLGDKLMRAELDTIGQPLYVDQLRALYEGRVPGGADLVAYWFEKAREAVIRNRGYRAGLVATQGIRGGLNRTVLERIKKTGDIFFAVSDHDWVLEGASVHISLIAFDDGSETRKKVDGISVPTVNPDLSFGVDLTSSLRLIENLNLAYIGDQKGGPFEISKATARKLCSAPLNPNGRPNSDVIHPWVNAAGLTGTPQNKFIIDFGTDATEAEVALYELPFEFVKSNVYPKRASLRRSNHRERWFIHAEARPGFRKRVRRLQRFIATPRHSKHRIFDWLPSHVLPDSALTVIVREDDLTFGVLSSRAHELWSKKTGTQVREAESGFRYTPQSCFNTFPFPWPPGTEPAEDADPRVKPISDAARELVRLRDNWLNPSDASEQELKRRTLTNLYNSRAAGQCTWLENAHRTLDRAVFAAYGWPENPTNLPDQEILARLLALNHQRAAAQSPEGTST